MRKATLIAWLAALVVTGCTMPNGAAPPARAASATDRQSAFELALARDAEFRKAQFVEAGMPSIDDLAAAGRQVRRFWLRGPYPRQLPILQLERQADGIVIFTVFRRDGPAPRSVALAPDAWSELTALDDGVFETVMPPPTTGAAVGTACHGDSAYFEAADQGKVRTAGGMDCVGAAQPFNPARRASFAFFTREGLSALGCPPTNIASGMGLVSCLTAIDRR